VGKTETFGGAIEKSHFRMGQPDVEIVALAEELGAGLVVVGSRGLSPRKRTLMGSVSESVVRHATARSWWCGIRQRRG
jgi:nucleotide-binding universal stress UspA family protein